MSSVPFFPKEGVKDGETDFLDQNFYKFGHKNLWKLIEIYL